MATIKQKTAFNKIVENRGNISKTMREVGYSKKTAKNPKNLTQSIGWQELLNTIQDFALINKLNEIALDKKDKRACLQAIDIILKLKDKYPEQKTKIMGLFGQLK